MAADGALMHIKDSTVRGTRTQSLTIDNQQNNYGGFNIFSVSTEESESYVYGMVELDMTNTLSVDASGAGLKAQDALVGGLDVVIRDNSIGMLFSTPLGLAEPDGDCMLGDSLLFDNDTDFLSGGGLQVPDVGNIFGDEPRDNEEAGLCPEVSSTCTWCE